MESDTILLNDDVFTLILKRVKLRLTQECIDLMAMCLVSRSFYGIVKREVIPSIRKLSKSLVCKLLPFERIVDFSGLHSFKYPFLLRVKEISLAHLTNLTFLDLYYYDNGDYDAITVLTNLTQLKLGFSERCEYPLLLTMLTNLRMLSLNESPMISDESLIGLSSLTELTLDGDSCIISGDYLTMMSHRLRILSLRGQDFGDRTISQLTELTSLEINVCDSITDASIKHLTGLKTLLLGQMPSITVASISLLTSLERLQVRGDSISSTSSLTRLTNLTSLETYRVRVYGKNLVLLSRLTSLNLRHDMRLTGDEYLEYDHVSRLRSLSLGIQQFVHSFTLAKLVNLTLLDLPDGFYNSLNFGNLTNLTELHIPHDYKLFLDELVGMTRLKILTIVSEDIMDQLQEYPITSLTHLTLFKHHALQLGHFTGLISLRRFSCNVSVSRAVPRELCDYLNRRYIKHNLSCKS